jgi:hypothetical protein
VLVGDLQRADRAGGEVRFAAVELVSGDLADPLVAAAPGVVADLRKARELFLVPRDQQGPRALEGDADLLGVDREQGVAAGHEPGFE